MSYDNNNRNFKPSQKFTGNWKCADCGKEITELPFQPDENRLDSLRCRDCYKPKKTFRRDRF